jgi:hypothetical protein
MFALMNSRSTAPTSGDGLLVRYALGQPQGGGTEGLAGLDMEMGKWGERFIPKPASCPPIAKRRPLQKPVRGTKSENI